LIQRSVGQSECENQAVARIRCWSLVRPSLEPRCRPSRRLGIRQRRRQHDDCGLGRPRSKAIREVETGPRVPESSEMTGGIQRAAGNSGVRLVRTVTARQRIIRVVATTSWKGDVPIPSFHPQERKREPFGCQTWKSALDVRRPVIFLIFLQDMVMRTLAALA
jgi:hypothetical protein